MKTKATRNLFLLICAVAACCALALAGCGQSSGSASASSGAASSDAASSSAQAASATAAAEGGSAVVTVEGYDPFTIKLDAAAAPATVANFRALAQDGYYNGLTFYRFAEGFCMQGGTKGNSPSGSDSSLKPIEGEFAQNGHDNPLADNFAKGTVAMARTGDPNSATSTFFVTLDSSQSVSLSLNGQYAAFGTIDEEGMAIIDKIVADYLPKVDDPQMGVIAQSDDQAVISSIEIVD